MSCYWGLDPQLDSKACCRIILTCKVNETRLTFALQPKFNISREFLVPSNLGQIHSVAKSYSTNRTGRSKVPLFCNNKAERK